jgi:hypothetical protein
MAAGGAFGAVGLCRDSRTDDRHTTAWYCLWLRQKIPSGITDSRKPLSDAFDLK